MASVVIVYHSAYGHTGAIARSVLAGAAGVEGVRTALVSVDELPDPGPDRTLGGRWGELDAADAIVFGCPTYMGTVSAAFKRFMDASSVFWMGQWWKDKLAAGFTNGGGLSGDKLNTLTTLMLFACQHSMLWVSQGVMIDGQGANRMSSWSGLMARSEDGPPSETPPPEDHETAKLFGARVARATLRWTAGAVG